MKLSNENQTLSVGDTVITGHGNNGEDIFTIVEFILHLDAILIKMKNVKTGEVKTSKGHRLFKIN